MGLEDLSLFRSLQGSVILYPSDAVSCMKLVEKAVKHKGIVYIRITRAKTPVIYNADEEFKIGGSKILKKSDNDVVTLVTAGITLHEALRASEILLKEGVSVRVIDLYSIKPLDVKTLKKAVEDTKAIIVIEDHYAEGGIGEAVCSALCNLNLHHSELVSESNSDDEKVLSDSKGILDSNPCFWDDVKIVSLAVRKMPRSGKPEELLRYEEIDAEAIVKKVREILLSK